MKTTLKEAKPCPSCGKPMPAGALAGFCPACLLAHGGDTESGEGKSSARFQPPSLGGIAKLFPQLEILGLLGAGGMGAVYKARQPALDRIVALKVLPASGVEGANFEERFNREARALARLSHPNIVGVFEFGQAGALHFFIMEFVDGANLRQLERAGRIAPREALQLIPQICDALQYAHDEGVVHRDIKPENVLVDRKGRVKIADFGLAKILGQDAEALRLTREGQVMGTPHYMAPEQIERPLSVDHRADIYSLGVVLYEMLTGDLPIGKFSPPSRKVSVDVRFDEVVLRALENDPERRYQHASDVKSQVETIAGTPAPVAPVTPSAPDEHFVRWMGFPVVAERDGVRQVNRKGTLKAFGIIFGVMTLAFLFVSLLTGRTLFGWVGISGGLSLMMRLLISALLVVWGAWRAWSQPVETKPSQTPNGTVILPSSARGWKTVRDWAVAIFFMILAWNAFIAGWPKLIPLLRAWYGNRSSLVSQVATRDAATGALVAKLPGGSSIELLVLSEQAAAPDGWWLPDGTRLTNTRYEMRGPDVISPISGFAVKDILFRVIDLPRGASGPTIRFKSQVSSMRAGDLTVLSNGQTLTDAWPWRVALPEAVREETIGVGLGLEAWRTIYRTTPADWSSKSTPQPNDPYWKPSLHQVMDNAGNAQVTTTIQHPGENWFDRTVAVDTSGVEHEESSPGAGSGMGIRVIPKANERTWTYTFRDLPLTAVKEFRVQVRPVYWVEFRNVALQPREGVKPVALSQKFGPVMERTLNLHDTGYSDSLDLDTGKIVTPPKMETPWDWMTTVTLPAGIMVIPGTTEHPMMLAGTSTQVAPLPPRSDYWNGRTGLSDAQGAGIVKVVRGQTVTATAEGKSPQSFIFKTQSGQFGLLQITGFTDNLRAVKIRYKRVVNDAASSAQLPALAGGWEPAVTRGEQPDPEQVRNEANAFMQRGEFGESMRRHLWYHENAEKLVPGLSAVRRSFALSDWVELGRRYPKARQALVEVRDHKTHEISEGRGYFDLFTDVASINGYLQADRATCALFKQLQKADAALASQCYFAAEDALVKEREYAVCLEYIPNAQAKFEQLLQVWKLDRQNESKRPPLKGSTPPPNADSRLVTKIRQLIEILVGAGRKTEAQRILEQALDLVADPRLQSAVADAETRVKI